MYLGALAKQYSWKTWLLCLFFFLLPWQTRFIFGQVMIGDVATPFGTLSVYAVELLLVVGVVVSVFSRPVIDRTYRLPMVLAVGIFGVAAVSLYASSNVILSLVSLMHLALAMLLFTLLLDKKLELKPVLLSFALGLVGPSLLGIVQVLWDASPAASWLGLAARDAATLGDAITVKDGVRELRAYGSFSHPNVFGGYLAVGVLAFRSLLKDAVSAPQRRWLLAGMLLLTITLVLTASRSAIIGLLLGIGLVTLVSYMKDTAKARLLMVPIALGVIGVALAVTLFAPTFVAALRGGGVAEMRSVDERAAQYGDYPEVMTQGPLQWIFGNGLGAYTVHLTDVFPGRNGWDYQPIHNVPLLILAEIGLLGVLIVFSWSSVIDKMNYARFPNQDALMAFAMGNVILVVLFFDHYIWSSWSGLTLIAFVMALTVRMGEAQD